MPVMVALSQIYVRRDEVVQMRLPDAATAAVTT